MTPLSTTHELPMRRQGRHWLHRMVRHIRVLGILRGLKYWRIENACIREPQRVLEWADACDREATRLDSINEGLVANAHREWAKELRMTYKRWSAPNDQAELQ